MVQIYRCLIMLLLAASCLSTGNRADSDQIHFPAPNRPVAPIISSAYSDEKIRDAKEEAARVMERLGIRPGIRVADIGAGDGYYTVRLARRLGDSATIYAQDVNVDYLNRLKVRLEREKIRGVRLILGMPNNPRLEPNSIDIALLAHVYHEIENPYEFFYRLKPALTGNGRVAIIDVDRPTPNHGTPPPLLRCELEAIGYRQIDFMLLAPADGYLAVFLQPEELPPVSEIRPCALQTMGK